MADAGWGFGSCITSPVYFKPAGSATIVFLTVDRSLVQYSFCTELFYQLYQCNTSIRMDCEVIEL